MQRGRNCQKHILLLSGIGEGPYIAKALIQDGWHVTVSVVTYQASLAYSDMPLEAMNIGALDGVKKIIEFLNEAHKRHNGFDWVVDITHPFAILISQYLKEACFSVGQPLIRYERPVEKLTNAVFINSAKELTSFDLTGERILMAMGSRYLKDFAIASKEAGAEVYARILPTPESLRCALDSRIESNRLAVFRPFPGKSHGVLEEALCSQWRISGVLFRQSGGKIERFWNQISLKRKLSLFVIMRPSVVKDVEKVNNYQELFSRISSPI